MNTIIRNKPFYKGVSLDLKSTQQAHNQLTYTEGSTVEADGINTDPAESCGQGINFCSSIAAALQWGPVVVEITVPSSVKIVDTGDKLRAVKVRVGKIVDLAGAYLGGAYLSGANLSRAYLAGANLGGAFGTPRSGVPDGWTINSNGFVRL